ncbi:MAG: 3-hydroxyacyl-CoA dehydrogenase/enoyl-CoA hydratase family protein [Acidobacteria bacterium]|nr:3-hydroxyacyl-CoA dehydrogenase/enoyl-CoA hydratase family protein [Acidobacteriota bacterium]
MRKLGKVAVLGAGTMGSRIAAHFANAGVDCLLMDIPAPGGETPQARNAIVEKSLKGLAKSRPPAFFTEAAAKHLRVGNFQDDLDRVRDAEWIIEVVVEKFDVKRQLLEQVDRLRRPGSLVSSNTSGLPIGKLAEGLSDDFRKHWLGTHFFNPPRHMRLVELIPTPETAPEVTAWAQEFCDKRLGKAVVFAKDRPNFIANRIFLFSVMHTLKTRREQGLTVEEVDALTGPLVGRPRMATFRLADFTGIDICLYVGSNLYELVPDDEQRDVYVAPEYLKHMVEQGIVGDKAGQGFYKKDRKAPGGRLVIDLDTLDYREMKTPEWESVSAAKRLPTVVDRVKAMIGSDDAAGRFIWTTLSELFLYAANRIPEVCDDIVSIDRTMTAGFNWERGIFEIWNGLGVRETTERMTKEGKALPALVEKVLASPSQAFYGSGNGQPTYFDLAAGGQKTIPEQQGVINLRRVRGASKPVEANAGASLWDIGDGAALLEFHSKANALDQNVFEMLARSVEIAEERFDALVIGNQGENFCVGANLQMILGLAMAKDWEEMGAQIGRLQQLVRGLRAARKPVVAAIHSRTLGGGCEVALHCDQVQAAAETYVGLVEVGAGLIPAAGGCTETLRRYTNPLGADGDLEGATRSVYEMIGTAKVSNSGAEAKEMRYLTQADGVTMNLDRLLADAKQAALGLATAGYEPFEETDVLVGGKGVKASMELGVWMMKQGGYASDHDVLIGQRLAHVLAGGELTSPSMVSVDYMLGLEIEAFLSLAGEEKTQQRIESLLKTGRPLRN